ncbi:hypothetical protein [Sphingomonas sp.]|uniref:hypothetical protein n=1 Tax=Sphingomonas sp. TaxID=28214 RepID=UPI003D6D1D7B
MTDAAEVGQNEPMAWPIDRIISELQERHDRDPGAATLFPDQSDIERWTGSDTQKEYALYNDIATALARGFHAGELSFEFCDGVANGLFTTATASRPLNPDLPWPDLFFRVFQAFDAGEYHIPEDRTDDPVTEHTKPAIAAIVASFGE